MKKKEKGGKIKWIIVSVIVLAMIFAMADNNSSNENSAVTTSNVQLNTAKTELENDAKKPVSFTEKSNTVQVTESDAMSESDTFEGNFALTKGQQNALKSAESYLRFTAFSYDGLIKQLEFEKYSHEDAVYAADNCGVDWNEQALKSAKSYLDYTAFSYTGLIKQLEYEGYTNEQSSYAADNCGADWNEQAAKSAESYLGYSSFSHDGLIDQLLYEGFTKEEAAYGVQANGY